MIQELVKGEESTADTDLDLVFDAFDRDAFCTELIDTFRLPHEHDLQLLAVGVVVDVVGKTEELVDKQENDDDIAELLNNEIFDI